MTNKQGQRFTVISNRESKEKESITRIELEQDSTIRDNLNYQTNPMYEKLLNFRMLQEQQKKRFSVEDLLKW